MNWKVFTVCGTHLERVACVLGELGINGCEVVDDSNWRVYLPAEEVELHQSFYRAISALQLHIASEELLEEANWVAACEEVLEPFDVGSYRVVPTASLDDAQQPESHEIRLSVGMGFGTGHHATTRMMLDELEHAAFDSAVLPLVFDVGTGSGLLAIFVAHRYGSQVVAFEIDEDACENAARNFTLNNVEEQVRLVQGPYEIQAGTCDCLLANVYAEVLVDHEGVFFEQLRSGGALFLSGISADKASLVEHAYSPSRWLVKSKQEKDNWLLYRFEKV